MPGHLIFILGLAAVELCFGNDNDDMALLGVQRCSVSSRRRIDRASCDLPLGHEVVEGSFELKPCVAEEHGSIGAHVDKGDRIAVYWEDEQGASIHRPDEHGRALKAAAIEQTGSDQFESCGSLE
ncbi:hypothetical protein BG011_008279 [Mortierella polycephala]|uniref:Uncharacterized protein n=1 Tax=Mortierella polycephala TaxID=41804 RepID=A0A9P6TXQ6_9FUNG|nr:hypothetical protein BG011_008279 [Mortierella polycephala]